MKYIVTIKEIHAQRVFVEADSAEEAVAMAAEGSHETDAEGNYVTEYVSTMDSSLWDVEEEE
jgi:hypothetical protein